MAQRGICQRADVLHGYMRAAFQEGTGLGAENQELAGSRACPPTGPLIDEVRRGWLVRARGRGELHGVTHNFFGDGDLAHNLMETKHILTSEECRDRGRHFRSRARDYCDFLI